MNWESYISALEEKTGIEILWISLLLPPCGVLHPHAGAEHCPIEWGTNDITFALSLENLRFKSRLWYEWEVAGNTQYTAQWFWKLLDEEGNHMDLKKAMFSHPTVILKLLELARFLIWDLCHQHGSLKDEDFFVNNDHLLFADRYFHFDKSPFLDSFPSLERHFTFGPETSHRNFIQWKWQDWGKQRKWMIDFW